MGGRTAMTTACRYPDRVDGVISIDTAPVDESKNEAVIDQIRSVITFMYDLNVAGVTTAEAKKLVSKHFSDKQEIIPIIRSAMKPLSEELQWQANVESFFKNLESIVHFDENLRYPKSTVYQLIGE